MNIQHDDQNRNLRAFLWSMAKPLPHYFEDTKVQRRVGLVIGGAKMPPVHRVRTVWL
jgi:hypothetical protein